MKRHRQSDRCGLAAMHGYHLGTLTLQVIGSHCVFSNLHGSGGSSSSSECHGAAKNAAKESVSNNPSPVLLVQVGTMASAFNLARASRQTALGADAAALPKFQVLLGSDKRALTKKM